MSIHTKTMRCLDAAKQHLELGDESSLRYACLELRMGIEYLFYDVIPHFADELPTAAQNKWQPRELLDALVDCDPDFPQDVTMSMRKLEDSSMICFGTHMRPTKKLLRDHYHKLGFFLHAPQPSQLLDLQKLRLTVDAAAKALEHYRASRIIVNCGSYIKFSCQHCKHEFKRRHQVIPNTQVVRCLNSDCDAPYTVAANDDGSYSIKFVGDRKIYRCQQCKVENLLPEPFEEQEGHIVCGKCSTAYVLTTTPCLEKVQSQ